MKILVTNDDGIGAPGIRILAEWAKKFGEVTVVAPKTQRSAESHHVNIHSSFECREIDFLPGVRAWYVDSSPADCIRVADAGLKIEADLVFSGINDGLNVGWDIVYSATCGAAFEANYSGWKAIAFSTFFGGFRNIEKKLDDAYDFIHGHHLLDYTDLLNVNFADGDKGIRLTRQANAPYYRDWFREEAGGHLMAMGYSAYKGSRNLDVDLDAVMNGYTSISPLTVSRTDEKAYRKIQKLLQP
ncbi:MAG: hypothetical protein II882_05910 [Lachnospiraceae bacterium]|nr:hypothetical protein [Lachnospiraceae bacterium]